MATLYISCKFQIKDCRFETVLLPDISNILRDRSLLDTPRIAQSLARYHPRLCPPKIPSIPMQTTIHQCFAVQRADIYYVKL